MTWESFAYICRRAERECRDQGAIGECIARLETDPALAFYGGPVRAGTLAQAILGRLRADEAASTQALSIFSALEFANPLGEPITLRRAVIYLAYVVFVFYAMSAIYLLKVMPAFAATFAMLHAEPAPISQLYLQIWPLIIGVISTLLILAMVSAWSLRRLFRFPSHALERLPLRLLAFPGIRDAYRNIQSILLYPLASAPNTAVEHHLASLRAAGLPLAPEMQQLLVVQARRLLHQCEFQMRCLLTLTVVLIVLAVGFFLVGAYGPIFVLGETV